MLVYIRKKKDYPSDRHSTRWLDLQVAFTHTRRQTSQTSSRLSLGGAMFSVRRVSARCHRADMKNAAYLNMRDSVSFCKQILIEYVLRKKRIGIARLI